MFLSGTGSPSSSWIKGCWIDCCCYSALYCILQLSMVICTPLFAVLTVTVGLALRDVMEPAKIRMRQIRILYFKSVGFTFVTQTQLVQFCQVKKCRILFNI